MDRRHVRSAARIAIKHAIARLGVLTRDVTDTIIRSVLAPLSPAPQLQRVTVTQRSQGRRPRAQPDRF